MALTHIRKLYMVKREIKGKTEQERFWARRHQSLPILRDFKEWLDQQVAEVSTKSLFGEAVTYALNQWSECLAATPWGSPEFYG